MGFSSTHPIPSSSSIFKRPAHPLKSSSIVKVKLLSSLDIVPVIGLYESEVLRSLNMKVPEREKKANP